MNWQQIAMQDNQTILNDNGTEVTITNPAGIQYVLRGQVVRVDSMLDPISGQQVYQPKTIVTIPLASFVSAHIPIKPADQFGNSEHNPLERMKGWLLDTTDATGQILNRKIADAHYDRSIGFVNLVCEDYIDLEGFR